MLLGEDKPLSRTRQASVSVGPLFQDSYHVLSLSNHQPVVPRISSCLLYRVTSASRLEHCSTTAHVFAQGSSSSAYRVLGSGFRYEYRRRSSYVTCCSSVVLAKKECFRRHSIATAFLPFISHLFESQHHFLHLYSLP